MNQEEGEKLMEECQLVSISLIKSWMASPAEEFADFRGSIKRLVKVCAVVVDKQEVSTQKCEETLLEQS